MQVSFSRDFHRAPDQTVSNEAVVNRYGEEWDDVEDEEEGSGVDFGVQLPRAGVRGTGHKCLVGVASGEGVQVGKHSLRDGQAHREQPDSPRSETDTASSAGPVDIQRSDYSSVPEQRGKEYEEY